MTDLGNGLFAASVPEDATEIRLKKDKHNRHYLDYLTNKDNEVVLGIGVWSKIKILGTVTKLKIDFDYRAVTGLGTFDFYELLSSKGLYFENPKGAEPVDGMGDWLLWEHYQNNLIEKLVILKKV